MMRLTDVTINSRGELTCPHCHSANVHLGATTTFIRGPMNPARLEFSGDVEDITRSSRVQVSNHGIFRSGGSDGNPSARHNGVTVRFHCAGCSQLSLLTIARQDDKTKVGFICL